MIFRLDTRSGVATYLQLVQQVKHAVRLGVLRPGDQLPTLKEVVAQLAINPNTVAKAYRELERDGVVSATPGVGTFVRPAVRNPPDSKKLASARQGLQLWAAKARQAGFDNEVLDALWHDVVRSDEVEDIA